LGRHLRRRLDAESLRDHLLQASGELNLEPGVGSAVEQIDMLINWPPGESTNLHQASNHRSIYLCMLRHAPPPELAAFDLPDGVAVAGKRDNTILPTQSLFLLNSPLVVEQSQKLAQRILSAEKWSDQQRVEEIYRRCLQRKPTPQEWSRALEFILGAGTSELAQEKRIRIWTELCQVVLASNEFRYID
jgi:hypothetical protein